MGPDGTAGSLRRRPAKSGFTEMTIMHSRFQCLKEFGWDSFFESHFDRFGSDGYEPARVVQEDKNHLRVLTGWGELLAEVSGKLAYQTTSREELPAVGDWVAIRARLAEHGATIHGVLSRKNQLVRKVAGGRTEIQIVGANVDTVFLMTSLNQDFNLRRLERYLVLAWSSGANPVIVLSKSDLCSEVESKVSAVREEAPRVPVYAISCHRRRPRATGALFRCGPNGGSAWLFRCGQVNTR
jgi:ribosome biogenesis GTPase / thiamine phosphate phosphatase